jgi:hypothetical protein
MDGGVLRQKRLGVVIADRADGAIGGADKAGWVDGKPRPPQSARLLTETVGKEVI